MNRKLKKGPLIILIVLVCAVLFFVIRTVTKKPAEESIKPENTAEPTPAETAPAETPDTAETESTETESTETPEADPEKEEDSSTHNQTDEENVIIEIEEDSGFIIE